EAQKIAEARDHSVGGLHITIHERGDGVQRVEEEVRLELHLEHFELRDGEAGFELAGFELAQAVAAVVFDTVADGEDRPARENVRVKLGNKDGLFGSEIDAEANERQNA